MVPVSLPLPSGDSDSPQAFGGLSFRPKDSCTRPDPFSEPQSPHLCNGLVVLIPSGPFFDSPEARRAGVIYFLLRGRPVSLISPGPGGWLGALLGKLYSG